MSSNEQQVDLLISHSQILVRGREYSEQDSQWGPSISSKAPLFILTT